MRLSFARRRIELPVLRTKHDLSIAHPRRGQQSIFGLGRSTLPAARRRCAVTVNTLP